jgi:glycosyltransferase involved in cell wall biosynthesis
MVSISIILSTARDNFSIVGLPNLHLLYPTIESLKSQSFKNFELIVIDAMFHIRSNLFEKGGIFDKKKLPFNVKHIPIERNRLFNHRFPMDNRRWNVCGGLNTGLIHAEGELIVRLDDCCEFDSEYIKKFWGGYQNGYFPMAMHIRYLEGKPAILNDTYRKIGYEMNIGGTSGGWDVSSRDELLRKLYGEGGLVRDSRYQKVVESGGRLVAPSDWCYGYSSVSLEAALNVNGWDELFDFDKSLEDVDFGNRICMNGYSGKFLLDIGLQVIEHEHLGISNKVIDSGVKPIKCNWAIYQINKNKSRFRANSSILDSRELKFVRKESLRSPCSPTSNFYDDNCEGRLFDIWKKNQPIFNLREERKLYGL